MIFALMARPREFDRNEALKRATGVFWAKGYAPTSTDDLLTAMGIGRQSLYNAFQDKRALYLEALERYQRTTTAGHLQRLNGTTSPIAGIKALLLGLISDNDDTRALGCMGVGAICEFGSTDPDIVALRSKVAPALHSRLAERLKERRLIFLSKDIELNFGHPCGTCVMSNDSSTGVIDRDCRAHGIANLFIADASFMPTSGAINPSLTIAANALRISAEIDRSLLAQRELARPVRT